MRREPLLRRVLATGALLATAALLAGDGRAEGVRLSGKLTYENWKDDREIKRTEEDTDTDSSRFSQVYNIEFERRLFPYIDLRTGALLTRDNSRSTVDDLRSKFTDETRAYFGELRLDNPDYRAGVTYRDSRDTLDGTNLPELKILRENYTAFAQITPEGLPSIDVNYRHTDTRDKPRTRESISEFWNVNSRYDYRNFRLDYTYTRNDQEERLQDSGQLDILHDGSLGYSTTILGGRVGLTGGSQLTYVVADPSGGQGVLLPTSPAEAVFFLLDDPTPESNALGDFTIVDGANPLTNVDIGPSGPPNLVSFGVEFSPPTGVDTVYVLPLQDPSDPSLASPSEINAVAGLFSWRVFSSDDQENWTELTVARATYDVFENRFEIAFLSPGNVRFVKLVTRPLSGGTTRSILISQLQTFEAVAGSAGETVRSLRQTYSLGLRSDLSADTHSFYDVYYQIQDVDPAQGRRTLLTNSIGFRHRFGPRLVGTTRFLRSVSRKPDVDGIQNSFVAALKAEHLATFYQTLTYSALYDRDDEGSTQTQSVWLRNSAELHRNWSASLDLGYVRRRPAEGPTNHGPLARFISSIDPNRWMNLRLDYSFHLTREKHLGTRRQHRWGVQGLFVPTSALSLFASLFYDDDGIDDHRLSEDYTVSWAPLRDGALDLSVTYRRLKERTGREENTITPELRWQFRPGLLGILRYRIGSEETETEERDTNVFTAELQFSLR